MRKDLEREVVGKRFKDVTVKTASLVGRHRNRPEFVKALAGRKITAITRKGTWLFFHLDDDTVLVIAFGPHAGLTRETATEAPARHTQVVATFTTGGALHYTDPDRSGELFVVPAAELEELPELTTAGIDPLMETFTWHGLSEELRSRDVTLKALLVDEGFIVGLGDLYSDEILWAAGLHGGRRSQTLSSQEIRRLYRAILEVLHEAVKQGGAGEGDPGDEGDGGDWDGGEYVRVFGRAGQHCARCRQPIRHGRVDRSLESYYCPQCQT